MKILVYDKNIHFIICDINLNLKSNHDFTCKSQDNMVKNNAVDTHTWPPLMSRSKF